MMKFTPSEIEITQEDIAVTFGSANDPKALKGSFSRSSARDQGETTDEERREQLMGISPK